MQLTCHMHWTHSRIERFVAAAGDAPGEAHGLALHASPPNTSSWQTSHARCPLHMCMHVYQYKHGGRMCLPKGAQLRNRIMSDGDDGDVLLSRPKSPVFADGQSLL